MPDKSRTVSPGPRPRTVRTADGEVLQVPDDWELLAPGDAGLTRRVKAAGPSWTVQEKRGRRVFSRGVWAPARRIARLKASLSGERQTAAYSQRLEAGRARRARAQDDYVQSFNAAVLGFLAFAPRFADLAEGVARAVTEHATPVGSGTVARTSRIPVERRAEAAVIAWLRHKTTAYDNMVIPRIKGMRREVRAELAARSRALLAIYRAGRDAPDPCPLATALLPGRERPDDESSSAG